MASIPFAATRQLSLVCTEN